MRPVPSRAASGTIVPSALSIVIPAKDEAGRVGQSLDAILAAHFDPPLLEIIVVDDGSSDRTSEVAASRAARARERGTDLRVIRHTPTRGKGFSMKRGVLDARGDIVLMTDADLSAPIGEAPVILAPILDNTADVVIGSRAIDRSKIGVRAPLVRDYGGRLFNVLMRTIAGLPFADTQCGFKAFRRDAVRPVFDRQTIDGFGFDVEILYIARKRGLRLREVPVAWNDSPETRVRFARDAAVMFLDLFRVRLNDRRGRYN